MKIPFTGGMSKGRSRNYAYNLRVNCYEERSNNPNDKENTALVGTAGKKLFASLSPDLGSESRGMYTTALNRWFIVVGNTLFELDEKGFSNNRGNLNTLEGHVSMTDNGVYLMIVDGTNGYLYELSTNTLLVINAANYPNSTGFQDGSTHVKFLDQYAIVNRPNTFEFYISNSGDFTAWSSLDLGTAEASPDNIQALETLNGDLWVFCDNSIQTFYNSGVGTQPFLPRKSSTLEFGCLAKSSIAKLNNSLFWLGSNKDGNRVVFKSVGYNAQRISDHSLEFLLSEMEVVSDAVGWAYQQEGHYFYVLTFKASNVTYCWDDTTQTWHERSYSSSLGLVGRDRALYNVLFNSKNYVSDFSNGNIYELRNDYYTDNQDEIIRTFTLPHLHNEQKYIYYDKILIDMETGVGLVTGQGNDPKIILSWSDDGGYNWSSNRYGSIGKMGKYGIRVRFSRLGRSRNRVFKLSVSDPVKFHVVNTSIESRVGA